MYKHILVTLDGSPLSEQVLPQVKQLIAGAETSITLLTVAAAPEESAEARARTKLPPAMVAGQVEFKETEPQFVERRGQAVARVRDELEHYLEEAVAGLALQGVTMAKAVRFGDPADEIIKYANEQNVDLIMMATHGRTGLSRAISGSVADRVVTSGAAPVLLVRPESKRSGWPADPAASSRALTGRGDRGT
jgi:nucleotide-binding universal stress UspA family protein